MCHCKLPNCTSKLRRNLGGKGEMWLCWHISLHRSHSTQNVPGLPEGYARRRSLFIGAECWGSFIVVSNSWRSRRAISCLTRSSSWLGAELMGMVDLIVSRYLSLVKGSDEGDGNIDRCRPKWRKGRCATSNRVITLCVSIQFTFSGFPEFLFEQHTSLLQLFKLTWFILPVMFRHWVEWLCSILVQLRTPPLACAWQFEFGITILLC